MIQKLTALTVAHAKRRGMYGDGGGLWLSVSASGTKSWVYRFRLDGKRRDMGLGSVADISLAEARALAADTRRLALSGIDPIAARRGKRQEQAIARQDRVVASAKATGRTLSVESEAQLYRQFNQAGELLYVGIASNHLIRLLSHKKTTPWFNDVAIITIAHFATKEEAEAAEYAAIASENPRYNIHGGIRVAARRARAS